MLVSEVKNLKGIVGKSVIATINFADVPKRTIGKIVNYEDSKSGRQEIQVQWSNLKRPITDWFSRDERFDETVYLELLS